MFLANMLQHNFSHGISQLDELHSLKRGALGLYRILHLILAYPQLGLHEFTFYVVSWMVYLPMVIHSLQEGYGKEKEEWFTHNSNKLLPKNLCFTSS